MTALEITRGDTRTLDVTCFQPDGVTALDITGFDLWWTAKRTTGDPDPGVMQKTTATGGIAVTGAASGLATVTIDPADTSALPGVTQLVWDLQARDPAGRIHTLASGTLTVLADVTRATS